MKILAIGDTADDYYTLKKFAKRSEIHLIDFPKKGDNKISNIHTGREYFDSLLISKQVKKIKEIKDDYDLCIILSWAAARVAYLSGINYIMYYAGSDIGNPPFVKNNIPIYTDFKKPLPHLNWIERSFYKKVFDTAICHVASKNEFLFLKKYTSDGIRFDRVFIDTMLFNDEIKPINRPKKKFTLLSPGRIGKAKGMDIIWKALKLCKTDFEILQVEWFVERTEEEKKYNEMLIKNLPKQVKLIPLIKREELSKYIVWADAVMGQITGNTSAIERDSAFCKKPVIHYVNPNDPSLIDGKEIIPPFEPKSKDPHVIAELIDKIVTSKEYREKLVQRQYDYVKKLSDPEVVIRDWENLFEKMIKKYPSINRKSSNFSLKFENLLSNLAENLIYKRTMRERNVKAWGKENYELLTK
tara:strand:- start:21 stop:1259 length:1239 start_codon:yes stop_codon:yes gene_type:complete